MASEGGAPITMAEESLKVEKGTASEVGAAMDMTMAERFKELQDKNISLCVELKERNRTLGDVVLQNEWLDEKIVKKLSQIEDLESWRSESKQEFEKKMREVKRKTTRGQHGIKTPLPRLRLNQQGTTASASKAVSRMSGGPRI